MFLDLRDEGGGGEERKRDTEKLLTSPHLIPIIPTFIPFESSERKSLSRKGLIR